MSEPEVCKHNDPSNLFEEERIERREIKHALKACFDRRAQKVISQHQLWGETWNVFSSYIRDQILTPEGIERFEIYPGVLIDSSGHVDCPDGRYLQLHYSSDDGHSYSLLHYPSFSWQDIINGVMRHKFRKE